MMVDMETEYLNFVCNATLVEELQAVTVGKHGASLCCCLFPFVADVRRNGLDTILAQSKAVHKFCDMLAAF
jgi:hypothetical protein